MAVSVLLIGDDAEELYERAQLLQGAGHEVSVAIGRNHGIVACGASLFDIAVILLSGADEAEQLTADLALTSPATEVINVRHWYDAGLSHEDEPGFLLSMLTAAVHPAFVSRGRSRPRVRRFRAQRQRA